MKLSESRSRHVSKLGNGVLMVFGFSFLACGGGSRGVKVGSANPALGNNIVVHVVNDNYYSARIRALYEGGSQHIIGTVESHNSGQEFVIPWQPRLLWFQIDLVTGPGVYLSDQVSVEPGDWVELYLPPDLEVSGFFRRVGL